MAEIAECSECGCEMNVSAAAPFDRVVCPSCGVEVRVKVDFGNYMLQKRLAYGGMSVLFVAVDQTLGREVAVKVLNEEYSGDEVRIAQFENEAELTALVSHPNVVRVYSVGRAFGRFYIAMELIAGKTLEARLEEGEGISEKEMLEIALQVTAGLKEAKASGLIHRDIKPGNILVDEHGVTKIVDFGLSLVTQSGSAQAKEIFATPYYAPPEALEAGVEDFRSDIYALGASIYHALAGKPPIETSSMDTNVLLEAKRRIPLLRKVAPQVAPSTEALVSKMMAFDKGERWASYDEVTEGIRRALNGEAQVGTKTKKRRNGKKAAGFWLGGGLAALVVLTLGVISIQKRENNEEVVNQEVKPASRLEATEPSEAILISRTYRRARGALKNGNLKEAEFNFKKLFQKAEVPEPTCSWAGVEAGLCALLDGRSGDARLVFERLNERLETSDLEEETKFLLEDLLRDWNQLEPMILEDDCPSSPDEAIVEFAKALGNWEKGEVGSAQFFEAMVNQKFNDKKDWVAGYQEWAVKLSHDAQLLEEKSPNWKQAWSKDARDEELSRLEKLEKELQTSGRAAFVVASWQQWLKGMRASKRQSEQES